MSVETTFVLPSVQARFLTELSDALKDLGQEGLIRRITPHEVLDGVRVRIGAREFVCWCTNDYLGLSLHPRLAQAAASAAAHSGAGGRASRLLGGTTRLHVELEEALAAWFGAEAAIVFTSGYLANLGTLSALCSPQDAIFVDRLAHASLIDAARATRARLRVFRHNDPAHVADLLARTHGLRRRIIVTEGVFSMDGDRAKLAMLLEVAESNEALVYLDDAHGSFILGENGRGTPEEAGIAHDRLIYMATLGKALGCQGGFVIGPKPLIETLHNKARTFIYATSLAVPIVAAAREALRVLSDEPERREKLRQGSERLHQALKRALPVLCRDFAGPSAQGSQAVPRLGGEASHIVPVVVGATSRAVSLAERLWDRGIWAPAIRPPTVANGTARLRLSLSIQHTDADIEYLTQALRDSWNE